MPTNKDQERGKFFPKTCLRLVEWYRRFIATITVSLIELTTNIGQKQVVWTNACDKTFEMVFIAHTPLCGARALAEDSCKVPWALE